MNIERLQQVRDLLMLEETYSRFNMSRYFNISDDNLPHPLCETAACIAGHAIMLAYPNSITQGEKIAISDDQTFSDENLFDLAKSWLDLTADQASWLFYGYFSNWEMEQIPVYEAIAAIDHLIAGGEVIVEVREDGLECSFYKV